MIGVLSHNRKKDLRLLQYHQTGSDTMSEQPIPTRPVNRQENLLRDKFYESIAGQSDLMDNLAVRLLTLELAIPGIYATALKLISGDDARVIVNAAFTITFLCWIASIILTLIALTPRKWRVDLTILKQDPEKKFEALGVEDFFHQSALYKRRLLIASSLLFFAGIFSAVFTL